ncbi:MAG TPA: anti-sigma factor antagonist [Lachnospiraceae bacterium]|nr:anti-sigma factor antagonist [Lachnospiraceae bacterium]
MEINEVSQDGTIMLCISGEIDGTNVDEFENRVNDAADRTSSLVLDLGNLEYVSSAGLRVFLTLQKKVKQRGDSVIIKNVNEEVMDIFSVTGFVKLLNIEE